MGHPKIAVKMLVLLGLAEVRLGRAADGLRLVDEGLVAGAPLQDQMDRAAWYASAAVAFFEAGEHERATAALEEAKACEARLRIHRENQAGAFLSEARRVMEGAPR